MECVDFLSIREGVAADGAGHLNQWSTNLSCSVSKVIHGLASSQTHIECNVFLPQQTAKRRLFVCEEISAINGKFFEINGKFFFKSMDGIYCTVTHKNLQLGSN